jgi:Novel STAND NTPase 1/WD domain, G-beta repeat
MSEAGETEPASVQSREDAGAANVHLEARASGSGSIIQSGRDTHYYLRDGVRHHRQTDGPVVEKCPYPGLASFTAEQARWFFGRTQLIAEVTGRIDSSLGEGPFVLVAPSGAGKSSLIQAGLLPALARGALPAAGSRDWPRRVFTPTAHPMTEMAKCIGSLADTGPGPADPAELTAHPDRGVGLVRAALRSHADGPGREDARAVIVVDQLEELFTLCTDEDERRAFIDLLTRLAETPPDGIPTALVICGLRADSYAPCTGYPQLRAALQHGQILIGPMSESELRETILYPAESVGLDVEPGLIELLLRDIGGAGDDSAGGYEAGRLPLLAHALRATWQQRNGSLLTVDAYLATGGIQHAVATTADRVFAGLNDSAQETARWMFLRLVKVGDSAIEDTRRRATHTDILREAADPAAARAVLDAFTHARLLTQKQDTVEITHEALLRAWPSLREWIDSDRAGNLIRQELEDDAADWDQHGRDASALYRGSRLATARTWNVSSSSGRSLSPAATAFLAASIRQAHRATNIRRAAVAVLAALTLIASTAAGVAFYERATAQAATSVAIDQRDEAVSAEAATVANQLYASNPALAGQISLAAFKLARSPEAYGSLLNATATPLADRLAATPDSYAEAFNADNSMMATSAKDAVQLWHVNAADPAHPTLVTTISSTRAVGTSPELWFDPGNSAILAVLYDRNISLENINRPYRFSPGSGADSANDLAFSHDGRTAAVGYTNGYVRLWNVAKPQIITAVGGQFRAPGAPNLSVTRVAFSADGSVLATLSGPIVVPGAVQATETVRLWSLADPAKPRLSPVTFDSTATMLAFSPVGHTLATGVADNSVQLWNTADPNHPMPDGSPISGHSGTIDEMAFSADGRTLATASWDGSVRLWNVADPTRPTSLAVMGREPSMIVFASVAISPDGQLLAATGVGLVKSVGAETWLWKIDPDKAAADVCAASRSFGPPITQVQWRQYFSGQAYRPPCPG